MRDIQRCDAQRLSQLAQRAKSATCSHQRVDEALRHYGVCGQRALQATTAAGLWHVGSLTKNYVAAATLRPIEHTTLRLEDTIGKWLPNLPNAQSIEVRHLLNHTSGLYNYTDGDDFAAADDGDPTVAATPEQLIAWAINNPPTNAPGAAHAYSNTNYIVLGRILELATGEPFAMVLRRDVLVPAQLTHAFLDSAEPSLGDAVRAFDGRAEAKVNASLV